MIPGLPLRPRTPVAGQHALRWLSGISAAISAHRPLWLLLASTLMLSGCAIVPYAQALGGLFVAVATLLGLAACGGGGGGGGGGGEGPIVWPSEVRISDLTSATGFILEGKNFGDALGKSVAAGADVNGDGIGDMAVGAPGANSYRYYIGSSVFYIWGANGGVAHVIFGDGAIGTTYNDGSPTVLSGQDDRTGSVQFNGDTTWGQAGFSVALAKDVDGDNVGDIVIGEPYSNSYAPHVGRGWVVFGNPALGGHRLLNVGGEQSGELAGSGADGFIVTNASTYNGYVDRNRIGHAVATLDINGDGFSDMTFGAPDSMYFYNLSYNDRLMPRAVTVFGQSGMRASGGQIDAPAFPGPYDGTMFGGGTGYFGHWRYNSSIGQSLSAGDVNGDGVEDLIVGMRSGFPDGAEGSTVGGANIVFGNSVGSSIATTWDYFGSGNTATALIGEVAGIGSYNDAEVAFLGDVNADGRGDVAVTVPSRNRVYVVFGQSQMPGSTDRVFLASLDGTDGFRIDLPATAPQQFPTAVTGHDVTNDGVSDIIIGVQGPSNAYTAQPVALAHVIFGDSTIGSSGTFTVPGAGLNGTEGFTFKPKDNLYIPYSSGAYMQFRDIDVAFGDVNGDGHEDLIVGVADDGYADTKGRV